MKPSTRHPLHPRERIASIGHALRGLRNLFKAEPNTKIHALATVVVIVAGFVRHVSRLQWTALVLTITLVWMTEAFNTAIERLCDLWCGGEYHPQVKLIKDISAGAVLLVSAASVVIALLVFFY